MVSIFTLQGHDSPAAALLTLVPGLVSVRRCLRLWNVLGTLDDLAQGLQELLASREARRCLRRCQARGLYHIKLWKLRVCCWKLAFRPHIWKVPPEWVRGHWRKLSYYGNYWWYMLMNEPFSEGIVRTVWGYNGMYSQDSHMQLHDNLWCFDMAKWEISADKSRCTSEKIIELAGDQFNTSMEDIAHSIDLLWLTMVILHCYVSLPECIQNPLLTTRQSLNRKQMDCHSCVDS